MNTDAIWRALRLTTMEAVACTNDDAGLRVLLVHAANDKV